MKHFIVLIILVSTLFSCETFEILEDTTNSLKLEQVERLKNEFRETDEISFGYSVNTLWFKFTLSKIENTDSDIYIFFKTHQIKLLELYYYDKDNKLVHKKNGYSIKIEDRELPTKEYLFRIPMEGEAKKIVYFRYQSGANKNISHEIFYNQTELMKTLVLKDAFSWSSIGILILLIVIVSIVALTTKNIIYTSYLSFLIINFGLLLVILDYPQYFQIDTHYELIVKFFYHSIFMLLAIFLIFAYNLKELNLKFYRYVKYILSVSFIILLINLISPEYTEDLKRIVIFPLVFSVLIFILFYALFKKRELSLIYFLGFFPLTILGLCENLNNRGLISFESIYEYWQLALIFENFCFVIALLYKAKQIHLKDKKNEVELYNQEIVIAKQAKLATIGETLSSIEHQWRSPIAKASSIILELQTYTTFKGVPSSKHLLGSLEELSQILLNMNDSVSDFRTFNIADKKKSIFTVNEALNSTLKLIEFQIDSSSIKIKNDIKNDMEIFQYKNELIHVFLNIISNSCDILTERKINKPMIEISCFSKKDSLIIVFEDNAGGIPNGDIKKIFDQSYSKKRIESSGLGLFISKKIIEERMNGKLLAKNTTNGLKFTIELKKHTY